MNRSRPRKKGAEHASPDASPRGKRAKRKQKRAKAAASPASKRQHTSKQLRKMAQKTRKAAVGSYGAISDTTRSVISVVAKPEQLQDPRVEAWTRRTELPLAMAALVFLGVYAAPIINPDLPLSVIEWCNWIGNTVWLIFAIDYVIKLIIARHKWVFIRYNLFDLMIVVIPFFQPLRLLRLVFLLRLLNRQAGESLRGRIASYVTGAGAMVVFVGALAVLDVERNLPNSQITNFGDALWWSIVTITTVGYGDIVPIGTTGRIVATGLMIFGITILGTVTATLASWLVERVSEASDEEHSSPEMAAIAMVNQKLDQVLVAQAASLDAAAGDDGDGSASEDAQKAEMSATIADLATQVAALRTEVASLRSQLPTEN